MNFLYVSARYALSRMMNPNIDKDTEINYISSPFLLKSFPSLNSSISKTSVLKIGFRHLVTRITSRFFQILLIISFKVISPTFNSCASFFSSFIVLESVRASLHNMLKRKSLFFQKFFRYFIRLGMYACTVQRIFSACYSHKSRTLFKCFWLPSSLLSVITLRLLNNYRFLTVSNDIFCHCGRNSRNVG